MVAQRRFWAALRLLRPLFRRIQRSSRRQISALPSQRTSFRAMISTEAGVSILKGGYYLPGPDGVAPFKIDPDTLCPGLTNGCLRDIDVLATAGWTADAEGVSVDSVDEGVVEDVLGRWRPKRDLLADRNQDGEIDYLRSADLHFTFPPGNPARVHEFEIFVVSELPQGVNAKNGNCPGIDELPFAFRQCVKIRAPRASDNETRLIVTVPLWTRKIVVDIRTIADPILFAGITNKHIEAKLGEDIHLAFGPVEEPQPSVSASWNEFESFISTEGDPPTRFRFRGVFVVEESAGATEAEFSVRCNSGCDNQSSMELVVLPIQNRMEFDVLMPEVLVPKSCQTHNFTFTSTMPGTVGSARLLLASHTTACP